MAEEITGASQDPIIVNEIIGTGSLRAYGFLAIVLSTFVGMIEGYDIAAMSLAAPLLAQLWGLSPGAIGALLSASVVGLVLGSFALSPLGDLRGRRLSVVLGLAIAASATLGGMAAADHMQLLATRLVAGAGLGMALPNTMTLAMELVPWRLRSLTVVIVSSGLALGGGLGAMIVGRFVGEHGYGFIFLFGGGVSFLACLLVVALMPESPMILARSRPDRLEKLVERLTGQSFSGRQLSYRSEPRPPSMVRALFTRERRVVTLLLWTINFASVGLVYFFVNWTPSLLVARGASAQVGITASAVFALSGVVGSLVQVGLLPRLGAVAMLTCAYIVTLATVVILTLLPDIDGAFFAFLVLAAAAAVGAQFCLNAVVARYYPAVIRATGAAYATGAGRIGAIVAPAASGMAIAWLGSPRHAFGIALLPAALAIVGLLLLARLRGADLTAFADD